MAPPNKADVLPNTPAGSGGPGNFRGNKAPGAIGHGSGSTTAPPGKPPATPPRTRSYEFKPRIKFINEAVTSSLAGIQFPAQLNAKIPSPNYVVPQELVSRLNEASGGAEKKHMSTTKGLTVTTFSVAFSDLGKQWKFITAGGAQPTYKFQGGDVYLEATVAVYVQDGFKPDPNVKHSQEIFKLIYEHELEHVLDEFEIISNFMPAEAYKDERVKRYLDDAAPLAASEYNHWIAGAGLLNWLQDGLWAPEHNRRKHIRDSTGNYATLGEKINKLFQKQANPKLNLD